VTSCLENTRADALSASSPAGGVSVSARWFPSSLFAMVRPSRTTPRAFSTGAVRAGCHPQLVVEKREFRDATPLPLIHRVLPGAN